MPVLNPINRKIDAEKIFTKLKKNTPILIDFGVKYKKYCSDLTRCFFFGKPTKTWLKTFALVQKAQEAGIVVIKPKNKLSAPDQDARKVLGKQKKYFSHSFGHGVGLEIHESPSFAQDSKGVFTENMVRRKHLFFPLFFV